MENRTTQKVAAILSAAGFLLCVYLTTTYYTMADATAYCAGELGCNEVLTSGFSKMFGLPASLFGAIGYAAVGLLCATGKSRAGVIALASGGLGFSAYLSWAEFFVIKQLCPFCLTSAVIMVAVWALSLRGAGASRVFAGIVIAMFSAGAVYSYHALAGTTENTPARESGVPDSFAKGLATHLKNTGAVMYGSFKCPACTLQKSYFGAHAKELNYVECHPDGRGANTQLCAKKGIKAFPTWEIGGRLVRGSMRPDRLAELSGYKKTPGGN